MNLKKFLINFLFILIFLLMKPTISWSAEPVAEKRLNIVLNQTSDFTLTLNNIGIETGPFVDYKLDYSENFYTLKIIDVNNIELFKGETLKSYLSMPPDFVSVSNFTQEIIIANPINLFLPYFNEAAKVQLFDENNVLKLEIILAEHNLQGLHYRYAACDACGFCPPDKPPSSWESCKKCLYPDTGNNPANRETLIISDTNLNSGPTPQPDKAYTGLGCIDSSPAKTAQYILNILFSIIGGVAFIFLLYGSFIVTISQANTERLNYGRLIIKRAVYGLIFALLSGFIVNFIATGILKIPGFG